ncbi:hypothetical protein B0A50_00865 [Salinomyces thailandicus]|uniref:DRBM domain-containing protein n=1 Tax=Salinomyces thailandicus TaxID=706561 RepID=A0A4U0UEM4_9PEZI|nr:hypothetical protein B0A50_00865 [Salinomyces thailandica]
MNDDSLESVLAQLRKGTSTPPTASSKHDDTKHAEQLQHRKAALTPQAEAALIEAASINKSSEMEPMSTMDSSTVLASAQTVPAPSSFQDATMHDYPALQSVDDFMKENPLLPKTRSTPLQAAKASKASEAPGVAKVAKVDPIHLIKFHDTCSKHSIAVSFDYDMPGQTCHSASVQFGERRVEVAGPWTSKKQAKEALCKIAWPQLAELDQQLSSKRKISEAQPSRVGSVGSDVLTKYAQSNRLKLPHFAETRTATAPFQFACTVRIADGPPIPFGSASDAYSSKQDAKRAAARAAVIWLRNQDKMREAPPSVKRMKTEAAQNEMLEGHTGLTQTVENIGFDAPDPTPLPKQVHDLAATLGFSPPIYESRPSSPIPPGQSLHSSEANGAFIDMHVVFSDKDTKSEPALAGQIGRVQRVHGKKKAKELCCREVLRILEQLMNDRARTPLMNSSQHLSSMP